MKKESYFDSPAAIPHDLVSTDGPEHAVPQALPAIQDRDRDCVPDPHRVEQAPQAPYPVHRELTGTKTNDIEKNVLWLLTGIIC